MANRGNPMAGKGDANRTGRSAVELWAKRRRQYGVSWRDVDCIDLKACLATCVAEDVAIMISGASGGTGVCVTVWVDRVRHKEYANSAEELLELLNGITDAYSSKAEDIRAAVGGPGVVFEGAEKAAAD